MKKRVVWNRLFAFFLALALIFAESATVFAENPAGAVEETAESLSVSDDELTEPSSDGEKQGEPQETPDADDASEEGASAEDSADQEPEADPTEVPSEEETPEEEPASEDPSEEDPSEEDSSVTDENEQPAEPENPAEPEVSPEDGEDSAEPSVEQEEELQEEEQEAEVPEKEPEITPEPAAEEAEDVEEPDDEAALVETADAPSGVKTTGTITCELIKETGQYNIRLSKLVTSEKFKAVKVSVWSQTKDQDDLVTRNMKMSSTGKAYYSSGYLKDFKNYGKIIAEVSLKKADGTMVPVGKASFNAPAPKIETITAEYDKASARIKIKAKNVVSDIKLESLKARVWRAKDKSSEKWVDLKASGSSYTAAVPLSDFDSYTGKYCVQLRANTVNGPVKSFSTASAVIEESKGGFSYADKYAGQNEKEQKVYRLKLRGLALDQGVSAVEFMVWRNGEYDKAITYPAKADENGAYIADVKISDFKLSGSYRAKVFVTDQAGTRTAIKTKTIMVVSGESGGEINVVKTDRAKGLFVIALSGTTAPSGIKSVKFGVYTKSNKSDKSVYVANKYKDGSYRATVKISNHKYNDGTFKINTVVTMGNGVLEQKATENVDFEAKNFYYILKETDGRRVLGVINPKKTSNLKVAVWGEKDDQNDLKWYDLKQSGNRYKTEVVLYDHKETGTYNAHFYSGNTNLEQRTFKVNKADLVKNGWIYENGLKYFYVDGVKQTNIRGKLPGPYQICVNRQQCTITAYAQDGDNGFIIPITAFPCSVGNPWSPTPTGIFHLSSRIRWKHFYTWNTWVQYACTYSGGRFFHSVTCTQRSIWALDPGSYNMLGSPASHGCIRLTVRDAKWIYDNFKSIYEVKIYDSPDPGPFDKPAAQKIPGNQTWDPTDPAI